MVRKNVRCILLIMLTVILATGILNGCGKTEDQKGETGGDGSNAAKGRYVEKDMELPLKEGEKALSLSKSKDGNLLLFASVNDTEIRRYEYIDGNWVSGSLDWVKEAYKGENVYPVSVNEAKDGIQLVIGMDDNGKTYIVRSTDAKSGEALKIPYLEKKTEYGNYPTITGIQIDGGGNYWIQDMYQSKIVVVSAETLETLEEFESMYAGASDQSMIFAGKDGSIAVNIGDGKYTVYDKDRKETGSFSFEQAEDVQLCNDGENWYMVSREGIIRMKPGDESREVIMDGSMGTMGSPASASTGMICTQDKEFYVLYTQWKAGTHSLAHYVYDDKVVSVPEHTLRVFGLSESDTVSQAIVGFQKKNPDVRVEFQTSGKKEEDITSDDIRTLNTELLGGKGADILLLDGLPEDAYIEKGVLSDLTGIADKLMKDNDYLENIMKNTVPKDGKIYGIPMKFAAPVMYGDEQIEKALDSLDSLQTYLEKNPDAQIFGVTNKAYIRDFLFQMYQEELTGDGGSVDKAKMEQLLKLAVDIADNSDTDNFDGRDDGAGESVLFNNPGSMYITKYPKMVATDRIYSLSSMMIPCKIAREQKLTLKPLKNYYIPIGIVGINSNTEQKDLAEEFMKYLFSEEVQGAQLDDGFPVLISALEDKEQEAGSEYAASYSLAVGANLAGEDIMLDAGYPKAEEVKSFVELCKNLENPADQERAVWNIYREEADKVLDGSVKALEGAENIRKKVELYLAE